MSFSLSLFGPSSSVSASKDELIAEGDQEIRVLCIHHREVIEIVQGRKRSVSSKVAKEEKKQKRNDEKAENQTPPVLPPSENKFVPHQYSI